MKTLKAMTLGTLLLGLPGLALGTDTTRDFELTGAMTQEETQQRMDDEGRSTSSVREGQDRTEGKKLEENPNFRNSRQTPISEGEVIDTTGHDTNTRFIP